MNETCVEWIGLDDQLPVRCSAPAVYEVRTPYRTDVDAFEVDVELFCGDHLKRFPLSKVRRLSPDGRRIEVSDDEWEDMGGRPGREAAVAAAEVRRKERRLELIPLQEFALHELGLPVIATVANLTEDLLGRAVQHENPELADGLRQVLDHLLAASELISDLIGEA